MPSAKPLTQRCALLHPTIERVRVRFGQTPFADFCGAPWSAAAALQFPLMRRAAVLLALAGCLVLVTCAPESPSATSRTSLNGPRDDYDATVGRFGPPDEDDSTDRDVPRPPIPTRWITYKKEHVRFIFVPDGKLGDPPPYRWKLLGSTDPRTQRPISPSLAVQRLSTRNTKEVGR
jgi:hypothetical protein